MTPRPIRALLTAALLLTLAPPASAATVPIRSGDAVLDVLLLSVDMERKRVVDDLEEFDRVSTQASRAETDVMNALSQIARLAREGILDRTSLEQAEQASAEARARVQAGQERRRVVSERLAEHVRRLASLRDEILRRRELLRSGPTDPLTGRWEVFINPGGRRGIYHLALDGTIISGDYLLDGGFHGSLRGTFIADRVVLERIDSERGVDAKFYGRLLPGSTRRIAGTWDGTQISPVPESGPVAGTWSAQQVLEEESESK
jgi:Skp family chaperone for outer membrane proteins